MTRPTILILSFSAIESDARVLKQVRLFSEQYDVITCGYGAMPDGVVEHLEIPLDVPVWRYDRALVVARQYRRAYWGNAAISRARELLSGRRFDVVIANDVDAVGLALSVSSRHGVHADLHEYAPRQKDDVRRWRLFVAPFMRWMCREFVTKANSVTTVGQGIADEYRRVFGIEAGVVTNAAPYAELAPAPCGSPIRLVHSGAALHDRNIMAIVDAVARVDVPVTLDLYLTPNDPEYLRGLKERADSIDAITVHDPVPYRELIGTLNEYDVGVHVLPPVNFNNLWALPNKFFDYVQARLGLIIGPSPEMARILEERHLGAVADDPSAEALARVIAELTPERVQEWKSAADASSHDLSAEAQTGVWGAAVQRLLEA